jgi:hypothetical protein
MAKKNAEILLATSTTQELQTEPEKRGSTTNDVINFKVGL